MGRKDNPDDARNFSLGDMRNVEAELAAASDPASTTRIETHRTYEADEEKAKKLLRMAAKACTNAGRGGLAEMKKSGKGWVIIITEPGGKKK